MSSDTFRISALVSATESAAALAQIQNLAPNRRGLLLAPLLAALPAGLLRAPRTRSTRTKRKSPSPTLSYGKAAGATDRRIPSRWRACSARPRSPARTWCWCAGSRLHERAARLRHRPAVLRALRHLVGQFRHRFLAARNGAGARRRLRAPRRAHADDPVDPAGTFA